MAETVNQGQTNEGAEQKTFTQAEVNAIVGDRLSREREKFKDYDTIKEKADKFDQMEEASKSEIQRMTEKADKLQHELDTIKAAEQVRDIRSKVAQETGIPANLLTGNTEEDCKAQADAIKAFAKPSYPNIRDAGEPGGTPGATTAQQFAEWFNSR